MRTLSLFLLESPLQVSNAISSNEINDNSMLLIRLNDYKSNDDLILSEIKDFKSKSIVRAERNSRIKLILWVIFVFILYFWRANKIYLGDARSSWMKLIEKMFIMSEVIYLDDGMATIKVYEEKVRQNKKVTFLTKFPLRATSNISIKRIYDADRAKSITRYNQVYFIGAALSANRLLTEDKYISIIKKEVEYYKERNYKVSFFPHRYESLAVTECLSEICDVKNINSSIESYIIDSDNVPEVVISFASTALFNLSKPLVSTEMISLDFLKYCILDERVNDFQSVYSFFDKYCDNIKVRYV